MTMKFLLLSCALFVLVACQQPSSEIETKAKAEPKSAPLEQPKPQASKPSSVKNPELIIETFTGEQFDLSKHKDKWVVVNFWATWCGPCLKEIPDFNAFAKKNSKVQFIGLAYEEIERVDMQAFLKKHPIDYPIAIMDVYNPPKDFETPRGLPMTVLIAPGGAVVKTFLGPVTSAEIQAIMDAAP
ncbi:MAG: TlpA family protein disulfide reductase [Arenimonas sp.]|nr:TlpA family protein disulfide reductase [Arenimonas sp.]